MDGRGGRVLGAVAQLRACWGWWRSHGLSPDGLLVRLPGHLFEFLKLFTEAGI